MKVIVNAISIKEGGSLTVLRELLGRMAACHPDVEWTVMTGLATETDLGVTGHRIRIERFPWVEASPVHVRLWYQWVLPRRIRQASADVLFSLTNYLPDRSLSVPTLLLVQHAGHFSPRFQALTRARHPSLLSRSTLGLKSRWVYRSVSRASRIVVQTKTLARAIEEKCAVAPDKIAVVPHGPGLVTKGVAHVAPVGSWRLGYITKFGVQKNFGVVFRAARELRARGHDISLLLTLDERSPEYADIRSEIGAMGIEALIDNRGDVAISEICPLYDSLDVFIFASVCESFGFPMVEAMARGLPLMAADVDSNREVADDAACYFPADDAMALADRIEEVMGDGVRYRERVAQSVARAANFDWDRAAADTFVQLEMTARLGARA
jgi:glycosyltransferase involved in cell wall biosynthesis